MNKLNSKENFLGFFLGVIGYTIIVLVDSIIKLKIVANYPVIQISFFICTGAFMPILTTIFFLKQWNILINNKIYLQLLHGVFGLIHGSLIIYSLKFHSLIEIYPILFSTPLILTICAYLFLKEKIGLEKLLIVSVGFLGVLFVARPGTIHFTFPLFGLFIAAIIQAIRVLVIRHSKDQSSLAFTFYGCLSAFIISGLISIQNYTIIPKADLTIIIMCGSIAGLGGLCFALASKLLESSLFAPIQYIQIVVGFLMGYIFFGDLPDTYEFIGSVIIMLSGLLVIYRGNEVQISSILKKNTKIKDMFFR